MIDRIVVTGCSFSTGMEMAEHLLDKNEKNRRLAIWKWYKNNFHSDKKMTIDTLDRLSSKQFQMIERDLSWPALLSKKLDKPVENLSVIGGSIGRSLIQFSDYLKTKDSNQKIIAIHQLPSFGRLFLKFLSTRIDICPSDNDNFLENIGYDKRHYENEIQKLKKTYKKYIIKEESHSYMTIHYKKCLNRIQNLGKKHDVMNYFILDNNKYVELIDRVLIKDFKKFRSKYIHGAFNHPIDKNFNKDLVDIIYNKIKKHFY